MDASAIVSLAVIGADDQRQCSPLRSVDGGVLRRAAGQQQHKRMHQQVQADKTTEHHNGQSTQRSRKKDTDATNLQRTVHDTHGF